MTIDAMAGATSRMLLAAAMLAGGLILPGTAAAKPRAPISKWFCASLTGANFDPAAAIAAFPLEKMPAAEEKRESKTDGDGDITHYVELVAEGELFEVSYRYAFKNDEVTEPYGFSLKVYASSYPESDAFRDAMEGWVKEFGKPQKSIIGEAVYAGPEMYAGGPRIFHIGHWGDSAVMEAAWWSRPDYKYAQELCK